MKQIAIFLAEGFEEIEGLTVVDILRRAGITIDMVSITGSVKVTGSHGIEITADKTISATDFTKLDMIVLPGGMPGTKNLESCESLMKQVDAEIAKAQVSNVADQIKDANGVPVLVQKVNADSVDALRNLGDQMRDKVGGVVVLAAVMGEKVSILTMATKDAVAKGVHAGNIVKAVAKLCGGGGGGRPDMAQAGAKDVAKVDEALAAAFDIVAAMVK